MLLIVVVVVCVAAVGGWIGEIHEWKPEIDPVIQGGNMVEVVGDKIQPEKKT